MFAAYLRGVADMVENPDRVSLPIRTGTVAWDRNVDEKPFLLAPNPCALFSSVIGQQIKITLGWGTPKFEWDWPR